MRWKLSSSVEYEIEQADIVMEKLKLALSTIEEAIKTISTEGKEGAQHNQTPQIHQSTPESEDDDHSPSPPAVTRDLTATMSANLKTSRHSLPTGPRTKHRVSFSTLGDDGSLQPVNQSTTSFPFGGFLTPSLGHSPLGNAGQSPLLSLFSNSTTSSLQTAVTTTSDTLSSHSPEIYIRWWNSISIQSPICGKYTIEIHCYSSFSLTRSRPRG